MKLIYNDIFLEHDTGMHPENAKRLKSLGPLEPCAIKSAESSLELIHQRAYIDRVQMICRNGGGHLDRDTIASARSYQAAVHAVGATLTAAETEDFALVRPPGHHAHPDHSSGFCLFNNLAIATQHLLNQGKRVLIFDFDGHLGDGTEKYFYESDQVLYWSIHQYPAFPGWGSEDEIGSGRGKGYTINVPLPPGSGDDLYFQALNQMLPAAQQFAPDVVAASAGFDAHQHDLLLDLRLSANAFYKTGQILREHFKNVFATLEGGYNVEELPRCLYNFLNGINGKAPYYEEPATDSAIIVRDEFEIRLSGLVKNLSDFWTLT